MKRLIVTADDFGVSLAVNDAVERAHRDGILSATSLMVAAAAAGDAVARARNLPRLRVGLHLVLVDGRPVLAPEQVPDLVDGGGRFRSNMALAGLNFAVNPRARGQLAREIEAQFRAFAATGLALDHVNAHKHFHLHPTIAGLIASIGRDFGARAVRVPAEPVEVLRRIEAVEGGASAAMLRPWVSLMRRRLASAGMITNDHAFGIAWSGAMTTPRLLGLLRNLPDGVSEIYCHPATVQGTDEATQGYRHVEELAALLSPEAKRAVAELGLRPIGFADLSDHQPHPEPVEG